MSETAPAAPATPAPAEKTPVKKKAKKPAGAAGARRKASGPPVSELITKAVAASNERSGVSLAALKKALAAAGYDVEKNNSRIKLGLKSLVNKGTLVQTKGTGASGSFKLNKKTPAGEGKGKAKKSASAKAKKSAGAAKKPKKATGAATKKTLKKTPKKAKKPAAAGAKKAAKSPKKAKAAKPKKAAKSPAKAKAVKPKAAKAKVTKPKTAKPKKAAPKKNFVVTLGLLGQQHSLDVGQNAALGDGNLAQQLVELFVVADGQLKMTGNNTSLLVVPGGVTRQLQDLGGQILEHSSQIHRSPGTDPLSIVAFAEQTMNATHGKLKTSSGRTGLSLSASLASLLPSSRHGD
ncbi:histone H1.4-like isoform X1 [Dromiciops gliroides]|uniref:histone H1.4-like isoform X1 n=1 Tax=Dromiciops gliroides TaxID=33562 RepID=UPI001CC564A4|nr:histone H1.4-like isoform X1 [Dromiciops gliroides]